MFSLSQKLSEEYRPKSMGAEQLYQAVESDDIETVAYFLQHGWNLAARKHQLIRVAAMKGANKVLRLMIRLVPPEELQGLSLVQYAAENNHVETMRLLKVEGVNIHAKDEAALRAAARMGNLDAVEYLLKFQADVHVKRDIITRYATEHHQTELLNLLDRFVLPPLPRAIRDFDTIENERQAVRNELLAEGKQHWDALDRCTTPDEKAAENDRWDKIQATLDIRDDNLRLEQQAILVSDPLNQIMQSTPRAPRKQKSVVRRPPDAGLRREKLAQAKQAARARVSKRIMYLRQLRDAGIESLQYNALGETIEYQQLLKDAQQARISMRFRQGKPEFRSELKAWTQQYGLLKRAAAAFAWNKLDLQIATQEGNRAEFDIVFAHLQEQEAYRAILAARDEYPRLYAQAKELETAKGTSSKETMTAYKRASAAKELWNMRNEPLLKVFKAIGKRLYVETNSFD